MAIYIVDDDPGVNSALTMSIQDLGHEVISCLDALSLFMQEPPADDDVVFIDLKLPGISGRETIRWLLRLKAPPRIIPISALSPEIICRELEGTGMRALRKPLSFDAVVAALKPVWS
jgi:DNA-binding response OmpR family regulator